MGALHGKIRVSDVSKWIIVDRRRAKFVLTTLCYKKISLTGDGGQTERRKKKFVFDYYNRCYLFVILIFSNKYLHNVHGFTRILCYNVFVVFLLNISLYKISLKRVAQVLSDKLVYTIIKKNNVFRTRDIFCTSDKIIIGNV